MQAYPQIEWQLDGNTSSDYNSTKDWNPTGISFKTWEDTWQKGHPVQGGITTNTRTLESEMAPVDEDVEKETSHTADGEANSTVTMANSVEFSKN